MGTERASDREPRRWTVWVCRPCNATFSGPMICGEATHSPERVEVVEVRVVPRAVAQELARYARHKPTCSSSSLGGLFRPGPCNCGLEPLLVREHVGEADRG